jgi:dihydroorotase
VTAFTFRGGRLVDPASGRDAWANVTVDGGIVTAVGDQVEGQVLDVGGCVVAPGFVDPHVHLREPGQEDAETVESGTAAAVSGGYTAVCAMANTTPVPHDVETWAAACRRAEDTAWCAVLPVASITRDLAGEALADLEDLARAGARYMSDDGHPVVSASMMRAALRLAVKHGFVVGNHAEESSLTENAQANEGRAAAAMGLHGWPHEAEEVMVARDVILAEGVGARLHIPHVSTAATIDVVRWAKIRGAAVTAEATPHHLVLTDEVVRTKETVYKVNPPLRLREDVEALRAGLRDGTIDMIATDHAPHPASRKSRPWDQAPCGMTGLESAFAVLHTHLVRGGTISLMRLVDAMSTRPARVFGFDGHGGPVVPGQPANLTVLDLTERWKVDASASASKSVNNPFHGASVTGRVRHTVVDGVLAFRDGRLATPATERHA